VHSFGGGLAVAGRGCARLTVSSPGRRPQLLLLVLGNSLHGCPTRDDARRLAVDPSAITVGVACGIPNSIVCDRVGIGVWLSQPAELVVAQVAGRLATLFPPDDPAWPGHGLWQGYLYGLGPWHGPLAPHLAAGQTHWYGWPPVSVPLRLVAFLPDGTVRVLSTAVGLHPGFG
jgi:hypothetical protein